MDLAARKSWFATQPEQFKILVLLEVLYDLTMVMRGISAREDNDLKWEAAWHISECHHRVLEYVTGLLTQQPNYPDDVIVEIVSFNLDRPSLNAPAAWDRAVEAATKFGAHLR